MTLREFAEPLGVTNSQISTIENDRSSLSVDLAIKISKIYDVSLDWLLMGVGTREGQIPKVKEPEENSVTINKDELLNLYRLLSKQQQQQLDEYAKQTPIKNIDPVSD